MCPAADAVAREQLVQRTPQISPTSSDREPPAPHVAGTSKKRSSAVLRSPAADVVLIPQIKEAIT